MTAVYFRVRTAGGSASHAAAAVSVNWYSPVGFTRVTGVSLTSVIWLPTAVTVAGAYPSRVTRSVNVVADAVNGANANWPPMSVVANCPACGPSTSSTLASETGRLMESDTVPWRLNIVGAGVDTIEGAVGAVDFVQSTAVMASGAAMLPSCCLLRSRADLPLIRVHVPTALCQRHGSGLRRAVARVQPAWCVR